MIDATVKKQCDEILLWRRGHRGHQPKRCRVVCEENRLAKQMSRLKSRCSKATDAFRPSHCQLNQEEVRYYEWCLSDAALHEEMPEWVASRSNTAKIVTQATPSLCPIVAEGGDESIGLQVQAPPLPHMTPRASKSLRLERGQDSPAPTSSEFPWAGE